MNEAKMDSGKTAAIVHITSRDNALFKTLRKLAHEPAAYRKQGKLWLEGDHLCRAALQRGIQPEAAVFSQSLWAQQSLAWQHRVPRAYVLDDALFTHLSALPSAAQMGFVLHAAALLQAAHDVHPSRNTVVLDRIQDAGNVGVLAALARRDLDQLQRHILGKTALVFIETCGDPLRHLGADGDQLDLHAQAAASLKEPLHSFSN